MYERTGHYLFLGSSFIACPGSQSYFWTCLLLLSFKIRLIHQAVKILFFLMMHFLIRTELKRVGVVGPELRLLMG